MRSSDFIGIATCVLSLLVAYFFMERYLGLYPCPLCILDRIVLVLMAPVFVAGLWASRFRTRLALSSLNVVLALFGVLFTGRHVWVQNQPGAEGIDCLAATPEIAGVTEFIRGAFDAQADCMLIRWEVFGLTIPGMTLLLFLFLLGLLAVQVWASFLERDDDSAD